MNKALLHLWLPLLVAGNILAAAGSAFGQAANGNAPKTYATATLRKDLGQPLMDSLVSWTKVSSELLVISKSDLLDFLKKTKHKGKLPLFGNTDIDRRAKSALFKEFLTSTYPDFALSEDLWANWEACAAQYDKIVGDIPYAIKISGTLGESTPSRALITTVSNSYFTAYQPSAQMASFATSIPAAHFRNFSGSKSQWIYYLSSHEAGHLGLDNISHYQEQLGSPLQSETETDLISLNAVFRMNADTTTNLRFEKEVLGIRALSSLFEMKWQNYCTPGAQENAHATSAGLDVEGNRVVLREYNPALYSTAHLNINSLAHLVLAKFSGQTPVDTTDGFETELKAGSDIAWRNPALYHAAVKFLFEKDYFPPGTPEYRLCSEFLDACEEYIEPDYLNSAPVLAFNEKTRNLPPANDNFALRNIAIEPRTLLRGNAPANDILSSAFEYMH